MGKFSVGSIKGVTKNQEEKVQVGAGLLSEVSKNQVMTKTINVPRNMIDKNPNNKYSIKGITSLANSIRDYTLIEPLHVSRKPDGRYLLLGGERRLAAIDRLIADKEVSDWAEDTLIPCVDRGTELIKLPLSETNKERYAIIITNKEARKYTDGDMYIEIQEWKNIIEELRSKGIEYIDGSEEDGEEGKIQIKGETTRDILTKTTGLSRGQINKFERVNKRGSDALKDALLNNNVSVSVAAKAVESLNEAEQADLARDSESKNINSGDVKKYKKANAKTRQITSDMFMEDTSEIIKNLKENKVLLDESSEEKYHFYIRQIENLLGGHK